MRFLLDTNVISEAGKRQPSPKVLNWLLAHESASLIPAIVLAERYQGAEACPERERRLRLLAELDAFCEQQASRIADFDAAAARAWAAYVNQPELRATPPNYPDSQIAAIAIARGLVVVTRNTADFPGVQTLDPF